MHIISPLSGLIIPLTQVPDPVFANGMMGNGIAIDPTDGKLVAPCDAKILNLHPSCHALTLELSDKTQILIHVGIDTVKLKGQGFKTHVKSGEVIQKGQLLIEFDLDLVALKATSMISPVIFIEPKNSKLSFTTNVHVEAGVDSLCSYEKNLHAEATSIENDSTIIYSYPILIADPTGLHARPSAVIAQLASTFASDIEIDYGGKLANAKSLSSIMSLEVQGMTQIVFKARGTDAGEAIKALEKIHAKKDTTKKDFFHGVIGSPGLASGRVRVLKNTLDVEQDQSLGDQKERLLRAVQQTKNDLSALENNLRHSIGEKEASIFSAHQSLIEDPELLETALREIAQGQSAAKAWQKAVEKISNNFLSSKNNLLASRVSDLNEVSQKVLTILLGKKDFDARTVTEETILLAHDLGPGELAQLSGTKIVGLATVVGGATSHAAIIARALNIPTIHGLSAEILVSTQGELVILDAIEGKLLLSPTGAELQKIEVLKKSLLARQKLEQEDCHKPCVTLDGFHINVAANLSTMMETHQAVSYSSSGIGLLRSELYFAEKMLEPTEDEQFEYYSGIVKCFSSQPVIIRTLDVGGDKPLSYLPMAPEANPFLGERGIRFTLNHENVFRRQIRALVRASAFGDLQIMFPMVTNVRELLIAKSILIEETENLKANKIPVGVMIEVPAAALLADQLAQEVDFFSIGTNDLTQYTLAMDRTHSQLSKQVDGLHPAVLQLIQLTVSATQKHGKKVSVCGGLASDQQAIPILLGLGVSDLSVSVSAIASVRSTIRKTDLSQAKLHAAQCLKLASAEEVRSL